MRAKISALGGRRLGGIIGIIVGLPIAIFGFLVMRNPMRLSIFAPGEEGYYQRMVLDTSRRNSLRAFGALMSLFGAGIATSALGAVFKAGILQGISNRLWALMGLLFAALWCLGVGVAIWRARRGESLGWSDWFQSRRKAIELGPIDVFPPVTSRMRREARAFTLGLLILTGIATLFPLIH